MRHLLPGFFAALAFPIVAFAADPSFTSVLTPSELESAGLSGLTPAQRMQLDSYVERYRTGALTEARQAAEKAVAEQKAAEARAMQAQADAAAARAEAAHAADLAKSRENEAKKAEATKRSLFSARSREEPLSVESEVKGRFQGWSPRQVFVLANGQRWQVANSESYYTPTVENPKVVITEAAITGYWMRFPDLKVEVRVKPIDEPSR